MTEVTEEVEATEEVETVGETIEETTFTQEQVDNMIKDRVARAEKDKQKAIDQAEKLAKMNADEKQQYEFEELQKENEELRNEKNKYSLGREATKMLTENGITADDDVLNFVVREDAETTKQAVVAFSQLIQSKVDDAVKDKLKGNSPRANSPNGSALTRESINAMKNSTERLKAIQENPHLFN